jgi:hypothetical protein
MVRLDVVDSWARHDGRLWSESITVTLKPGSENI